MAAPLFFETGVKDYSKRIVPLELYSHSSQDFILGRIASYLIRFVGFIIAFISFVDKK